MNLDWYIRKCLKYKPELIEKEKCLLEKIESVYEMSFTDFNHYKRSGMKTLSKKLSPGVVVQRA